MTEDGQIDALYGTDLRQSRPQTVEPNQEQLDFQ